MGSGQPYHVPVSRAVPLPLPTTVRYPEEDRPLSGDRTSASQTQASRPFHPSLPGFSFQLTVPPRVFLEHTHVPRKRKRTDESVAPLKPTCRCVRASQRQLRLPLDRTTVNSSGPCCAVPRYVASRQQKSTASNQDMFVLAPVS